LEPLRCGDFHVASAHFPSQPPSPRSGHRLFQPIADISTAPQHTFSVLIGAKANLFMRMKVTNPNP
jgi:hypothetical protein